MPSKDFWIITVLTVIMNGMGVAAYIRHRKIGTPRLRKADLKYGLLGWIPVWTMAWLFSVTGSRVLAIVFDKFFLLPISTLCENLYGGAAEDSGTQRSGELFMADKGRRRVAFVLEIFFTGVF